MRTNNFMNAFQTILFNIYLVFFKSGSKEMIPDAVKNCKTEWLGEDAGNNSINKFLESFEISNNAEDFIKSNEIDCFIKENKLNISVTKFTMELKKYCSIKKFTNVESKVKKVAGKSVRGWIGIKKLDNDDDESTSLDL